MHDLPQTRLRPLADTSTSAVVAGFIAMLTGYTSSLVLMFQAGQAAGLTNGQISSWIWALSIGMAICCIGLSLRYRAPIMIAWSTPGAALLITSLPGVPYSEAIGAYIFASGLIVLIGLTGTFDRLMRRIPASIVCERIGSSRGFSAVRAVGRPAAGGSTSFPAGASMPRP